MYGPLYDAASTKPEKTNVIASLVQRIRRESPGGGFVKQNADSGLWYEIGDDKARDKCGHAIRRVIEGPKKQKSSTKRSPARANLSLSSTTTRKRPPSEEARSDSSSYGDSSYDQSPSKAVLLTNVASLPTKTEPPLPSLDASYLAASSLPQNLLASSAASLGIANLTLPLHALQRHGLSQVANLTNINLNNESITSNPYIFESGGRIAHSPHLSGWGTLPGGGEGSLNNEVLQQIRQSLGHHQIPDVGSLSRMLDQPTADLHKQLLGLSASNKLGSITFQDKKNPTSRSGNASNSHPQGSDTTIEDTSSMEALLASLNPTPIGPNVTFASGSTGQNKDGKETKKGSKPF